MTRWVWALGLVALAVSGCGGNVVVDQGGAGASGQGGSTGGGACKQAQDFINKCGGQMMIPQTGCTGAVECQAECVVNTTCGALDGTDPQAAAALGTCLVNCAGGAK